jgi:hypothetical protein
MPRYNRDHQVKRWGGTTDDVFQVAREVQRLVDEATKGEFRFSITVAWPGREHQYETPQQFEEGLGLDLESVETVSIFATDDKYPPRVEARVDFFEWGADGRIGGTLQVTVNGIASAIEDLLERGRRNVAWLWRVGWALYGIGFAMNVAGLFVGRSDEDEALHDVLTFGGIGLMLISGLMLVGTWWAMPRFELRRPGEATRLQVLLRRLRWVTAVVFVAVVGVVVQQSLT